LNDVAQVIAVTDFELKAVVGKGAFGKVFLVEKREGDLSGRALAMKVLDKQVTTRQQPRETEGSVWV
jgi:serine/threonine protein kinase